MPSYSQDMLYNEGEAGNADFDGDSQAHPFLTTIPDVTRATTPSTEKKVQFNYATLSTINNDRIIVLENSTRTVTWTAADSVEVRNATWLGWDRSNSNNPDDLQEISTTEEEKTPGSNGSNGPNMVLGDGGLILSLSELKTSHRLSAYANYSMYIRLGWKLGSATGVTTSGVFTVLDFPIGPQQYVDAVGVIQTLTFNVTNIDGQETPDGGATSTQNPTSTAATPGPTSSGSSVISPGTGSASTTTTKSLGAGPIAGIVVGAVLGVALIAFLLWFFLGRRRRRADHVSDGAYASGHSPHDYLADKETHARVTESPHTPYSDDGQQLQHLQQQQPFQEAAIPASAVSTTAEHHPFAPYSEEHTAAVSRSVEDVTRTGTHSSAPNVNSNVSHLIEDGMTADEIRRLEEEEQALDAAIEQAGQGQGQGQRRQ